MQAAYASMTMNYCVTVQYSLTVQPSWDSPDVLGGTLHVLWAMLSKPLSLSHS